MMTTAKIAFPSEHAQAVWTHEHARRIEAAMTRPEVHAAWDAACLGMKTEGHRGRKHDLAGDLARHDARTLGEDWPADPYHDQDIADSEQRVRHLGTPTKWASMVVNGGDPCPADPTGQGAHGFRLSESACRFCDADMTGDALDRLRAERADYVQALQNMQAACR